MKHSQKCIEQNERINQQWKELKSKYPHLCCKCNGYGYLSYTYDPSPSGVGLSSGFMTDYESCPECLEVGKCPVCSSEIIDDENKCSACGWDAQTWQSPPNSECICW